MYSPLDGTKLAQFTKKNTNIYNNIHWHNLYQELIISEIFKIKA